MKKINVFLIFLNILMLLINFFVGPSIKDPVHIFIILTIVVTIGYIIKNKNYVKIIDNILDVLVIIFLFLPVIQLIFNTSISFSYDYNTLQENVSVFCIYILVKNLNLKLKNTDKLINIIIFSCIPVIIIAFDRLFYNFIWDFISNLNIFKIRYLDAGLLANFNYPNALAAYLGCILLLVFGKKMEFNNLKNNIIYGVFSFVLVLLILLTESRGFFLMFAIIILIYLIVLRNRNDIINLITCLIISGIGSVAYIILSKMFSDIIFIKIFILLLIMIFVALCYFILDKVNINKCIKKIKMGYIISFVVILLFSASIYVVWGIQYSKPKIYTKSESVHLKHLEQNDSYKVSIDFETNVLYKNFKNFEIEIYSVNKYSYREKIISDMITNYDGIKEYILNDVGDVLFLELRINKLSIDKENILIINNVKVNGKEHIINYKYIPTKLANIIKSFTFGEQNVATRFTYYKDSLKIIKDNWLFGVGSGGWKYLHKTIQSYDYTASNVHNFYLDMIISFGILGLLILVLLLIYIFRYSINILRINKDYYINLSIIMSLSLLLLHSAMDFDMSYLLIYVYFFSLIAIISSYYNQNYNKFNKVANKVLLILLFVFLIFSLSNYTGYILSDKYQNNDKIILNLYPTNSILRYNYIFNESNQKAVLDDDRIEEVIKFMNNEPYYKQNEIALLLANYVVDQVQNNIIDKNKIEYINNYLNDYILCQKFDLLEMRTRTEIMLRLYNAYFIYASANNDKYMLNEALKIKELLKKEYNQNMNNLSDYKKTRHPKYFYEKYMGEYQKLGKKIENI